MLESSSLVWATGFAALLVLLQFLPADWHRQLWYERDAITGGEYWRIVTGNLVHFGWTHLALNVGALLIGIWVFYADRTPVAWALAALVCCVFTNVGLYLFAPDVFWCVGMSGALHGLLIIGALDWLRAGDRLGAVLLAAWIAKLAWEQWNGAMPFSARSLGAPVITEAHLWGAIGGFAYWLAEAPFRRRRPAL